MYLLSVAKAKAKPKAVFEYVDDHGVTRRVGTLAEVPKKHVRSMLVIGAPDATTTAEPDGAPAPLSTHAAPGIPPAAWILPVVLAVVLARSKNFVWRVLAATGILCWAFYFAYNWFMDSKYSKPYEPPPMNAAPPPGAQTPEPSTAAAEAAEKLENAMLERRTAEQRPSDLPTAVPR